MNIPVQALASQSNYLLTEQVSGDAKLATSIGWYTEIHDTEVVVLVISAWGHYDDK